VGGLAYVLMTPEQGIALTERLPGLAPRPQLRTTELTQPLGGVRHARVEITTAGGRGTLRAADDTQALFDGVLTHRADVINDVTVKGTEARVRIGTSTGPRIFPANAGRESLTLALNPSVDYDIDVTTASGRQTIDLTGLSVERIGVSMASGAVDLTAARSGRIDISMASGTVRVKLPANTGARLEVSALSGDIVGTQLQRVEGNRINGVYETLGFDRSARYLHINVSMLSGTVIVEGP
jgi:hypothetical protein